MTIAIVFVALRDIKKISENPAEQIKALVERIETLRPLIKEQHPDSQCVIAWHEKIDPDYLKKEILNLIQSDSDLHIIAGATIANTFQQNNENSAYYFHGNDCVPLENLAPGKKAYHSSTIWQPYKEEYTNPIIINALILFRAAANNGNLVIPEGFSKQCQLTCYQNIVSKDSTKLQNLIVTSVTEPSYWSRAASGFVENPAFTASAYQSSCYIR